MYKLKKILIYFFHNYCPDSRALSLMRIALALVVLSDLVIRSGDLSAHYTDEGIWPSRLVFTFLGKPGAWSLHNLHGSFEWVAILFAIHFIAGIFLLLGYKTRLANLVVWLLLISLHNRNVYVLQGGDDLLRLLLFWGLFLPWNSHYSIDRKVGKVYKGSAAGSMGYLLLLASVYFFSVCLKSSDEWHAEGSAIYYALSLDQLRLPVFGDYLYQFPTLMKLLTWASYFIEFIIPVLILWPSKSGKLRFLACILIFVLHTCIGLTLYVGLFFIINIVSAIGLLPAGILLKIEKALKPQLGTISYYKLKGSTQGIINSFIAAGISLSLIINLASLPWFPYELQGPVIYPVNALRLNQYWGMFSPSVLKKDGWYVYYGADSLGRQWDLRLNQDYVVFTKPEHVVSMYKTDRWRKLAENMQMNDYTFLRPRFAKYVLAQWNKKHPERKMAILNFYFMEEETLPDYKTGAIKQNLFCICNNEQDIHN